MSQESDSALVPRPPGALEKAEPGAKRILAGMVTETLALAQAKLQAQSLALLQPYASAEVESWYQQGESFYYGKGVPEDYAEAVKWYRKAAEQGHATAQTTSNTWHC